MKYERMLAEHPEAVRVMSKRELEGYLEMLEDGYRSRVMELLPACMADMGASEELKASDFGTYYTACEQAQTMAREIALSEMLEA